MVSLVPQHPILGQQHLFKRSVTHLGLASSGCDAFHQDSGDFHKEAHVACSGQFCVHAAVKQLLLIHPPGPQESWLISSEGSENGMLLSLLLLRAWAASQPQ